MTSEKELLTNAMYEIRQLRKENTVLGAKARVVEVFAAALGLNHPTGMIEDVAWRLEQRIKEIDANEEKEAIKQQSEAIRSAA